MAAPAQMTDPVLPVAPPPAVHVTAASGNGGASVRQPGARCLSVVRHHAHAAAAGGAVPRGGEGPRGRWVRSHKHLTTLSLHMFALMHTQSRALVSTHTHRSTASLGHAHTHHLPVTATLISRARAAVCSGHWYPLRCHASASCCWLVGTGLGLAHAFVCVCALGQGAPAAYPAVRGGPSGRQHPQHGRHGGGGGLLAITHVMGGGWLHPLLETCNKQNLEHVPLFPN